MIVESIVAKALNLNPADVTETSSQDTIAEWDSMGHLSLVTNLEDHFRISIAIPDAMKMTSVAMIKSVLKDYGVAL